MTGRLCTTITSGGSNPVETTVPHETTVSYSATSDIETVTVTYEFKILSEVLPKVFQVSGDHQATEFHLDKLETSLSGVLLLVEHDGRYSRLWTWLWNYGLSRDVFNSIHLAGDGPAISRLGRDYVLSGCTRDISVYEEVLERKWAGRLLIQQYYERFLLFRYLWQDIQTGIASQVDGTLRSMRVLGAKFGIK
ncbi:hypothetical protein BKA61DRAFT_621255 [Leptodontidium sp. MPI-SDFR-AT-0119]|nr:hypothetical protein BKA61DRAFT_621255 [Leptodontidium sp. MPI-SDFR-AT-0119]